MTDGSDTSSDGGNGGEVPGDRSHHRPLDAEQHKERLGGQVDIILRAIEGAATHPADRPDEMQYLHREGRILVRDADLDRVRAIVPGAVVDPLVNGLTAFAPEQHSTLEALDQLDAELGVGVATPDHIFYVTPASCCPATEPSPVLEVVPDPAPAAAGSGIGHGSFVSVVDTGFIPTLENPQHSWLAGVTGDEEDYDPMNIGEYVGHGSFVAGVLRCIAPDAQVQVEGMLTHGGAVTESDILLHLSRALDQMPDVISMSAGCTTRHNLPPVAFEVLWERRLKHYKGTVLVVAAGNNGARQPFWPAAYEWTVSVGALDRDGDRAAFSDFGSWVDLYAPGVDIVNAYPNGTYNYREPPRTGQTSEFTNGMASWSGTSFATPIVAGMIAARMSRTGQSGRLAADDILRIARGNAKPGVGAIADPAMTFDP